MIIAIDPGTHKCGVAILSGEGKVAMRLIFSQHELLTKLPLFIEKYKASTIVMGKTAFGKDLAKKINAQYAKLKIVFVPEDHSTLEARKLYWQENEAKGIMRLIPTGLRIPPVLIDDYAAVVLGQRYLKA